MSFFTSNDPIDVNPCPYCAHKKDGTPKYFRWPFDKVSVVCPICHATGPIMETEKGAVSMWNLRTKPFGNLRKLPNFGETSS